MNRLILCLKKNDQYNPYQPNLGAKNMMPVFWWDETTMGEFILRPETLQAQAFLHVEISREYHDWLKWAINPVEVSLYGRLEIIRDRRVYFDEESFGVLLNDPEFSSKMRSPLPMPIYDGKHIDLTKFFHYSMAKDWAELTPIPDVRAVTSGTYSIKSGGDYSLISSFKSDIGTLTGNISGEVGADLTETSLSNFTHDASVSAYLTTITSDTPHDGVYADGWQVSIGHSSHCTAWNITNHGGMSVSHLKFKRTTAGASLANSVIISNNAGLNGSHDIHDLIVDGNGLLGSGILMAPTAATKELFKCVVWDFTGAGCYGIYIYENGTYGSTLENIVLDNNQINLDNNSSYTTYRNIFSANSITASSCFTESTNATGNNLASTDTTAFGTSALTSLTLGSEVESDDDTNTEFLVPSTSGSIYNGGSTPQISGNTTGIRGVSWDGDEPSIGPFSIAGGASIPLFMHHYTKNIGS